MKCKFCQQEFEAVKYDGKLRLPLHRDAPGSNYGCRGANAFVKDACDLPEPQIIPAHTVRAEASSFKCLTLVNPSKIHDDIQARFEIFHKDNPKIYEMLVRFSFEAKEAGFKRFSIRPIVERLRWYIQIETKGDAFKINNDFSSRYARKIMQAEPELTNFFETRILKAEKEDWQAETDEREEQWWQK